MVISAQDIFGGVLKGGTELTSNIQVLALVFSARIQMEMGNVEEAMSLYSTALPHIGLDPMVIGDVARMLMDSGRFTLSLSLSLMLLHFEGCHGQ